MEREEFKKMTSVYETRLRQLSDRNAQATLTAYFDRVRSMDEVFGFMQRFEVKKAYDCSGELDFKELTQRLGEPVYDAISCCWLIIEDYRDGEIHFNDGTSVRDDPNVLKGRFFDKWQDLTEEQLFTKSLLRRTEAYESLSLSIWNSEKMSEEKITQLERILDELASVKEELCLRGAERQIVEN
ncbi:hypothetical protein AAA151_24690, partial [[Clostridium] innocuum]